MPTGSGGGGSAVINHDSLLERTLALLNGIGDALENLGGGAYPGNPLVTGSNVLNPSDKRPVSQALLQMAYVLRLLEQRTNTGGAMSAAWGGPQGANDGIDRLTQFEAHLLSELQQKPYANGGVQFNPNIPWAQSGASSVRKTRYLLALAYTLYGELLQKPPNAQNAPPIPNDPCAGNLTANPSVVQADTALLQINDYLYLIALIIPTKTI